MDQSSEHDMQNRVVRLERQVRFSWVAAVVFITIVVACMNSGGALSTSEDTVLRVRGLVVVDDQGNDRILLGAPVPFGGSRVRQDTTNGLLILDANGVDRVAVGSPTTNPQIMGKISRRISPAVGMSFNDKNGNERGGMAVLDGDDRVVLGLDRESGEGVMLFIMPNGYSGLVVNGANGRQRIFIGNDAVGGTAGFYMDDTTGTRRLFMSLDQLGSPLLKMVDEDEKSVAELPKK